MLDVINQIFHVIQGFVNTLFNLTFLPGISIGSLLIYSFLAYAVCVTLYNRG